MVDEGTSSIGGELALDSPSPIRRSRRALWAALTALAVAAGALAVTSAGGSDGDRDRLPVALGASAGGGREAAMAADMAMAAWITYLAGDELPALGDDGPAYRVGGTVDEATVRALADDLGMQGDPTDQDGYWHLESGDAVLDVYPGTGGTWSYWVDQGGDVAVGSASSVGSACSDGCSDGVTCDTTAPASTAVPVAECEPGTKCADPGPSPTPSACSPEAMCTVTTLACSPSASCAPDLIEPAPPADLPTEDEARQIALELLTATGMDVDDAKVTVDGPYDAWYVNVEPAVDGLPVSGWYASVSVGSKGEVTGASGVLGDVEALGDYPTINTRAAVDRLNRQQSGLDGATTMDTPAVARSEDPARSQDVAGSEDVAGSAPAVGPSGGGTAAQTATTSIEPAPDTECKVQPDGREICEPILPTEPCVAVDVVAPPAGEEVPAIAQCTFPACPDVLVDPAAGEAPIVDQIPPCPITEPVPMPEPGPIEVVLTEAELILVVLPATDESGDSYLVPGYRFGGEDGSMVDVAAVTDDVLAPTTTVAPAVTGDTEPAPLPAEECEVLNEDDGSGTTHTIQTCPGEVPPSTAELTHLSEGETPQLGVAYYVDGVDTHCGWFTWAGRWWATTDVSTPLPWSTPTEGGSFTLSSPDEGTFVGDAAGTKVATFAAQGPAADRQPCL